MSLYAQNKIVCQFPCRDILIPLTVLPHGTLILASCFPLSSPADRPGGAGSGGDTESLSHGSVMNVFWSRRTTAQGTRPLRLEVRSGVGGGYFLAPRFVLLLAWTLGPERPSAAKAVTVAVACDPGPIPRRVTERCAAEISTSRCLPSLQTIRIR